MELVAASLHGNHRESGCPFTLRKRLPHNHFFQRKSMYGTTAAASIMTSAIG
jgi:hypothetical protein